MNPENLEIRKATKDDIPFIAWTFLTALELDEDYLNKAIKVCSLPKSLYSWKNAIIATIKGKVVGCLIAYDGSLYTKQREYTWKLFGENEYDKIKQSDLETTSGEYYLDSMSILPAFRGHHIGRQLILYVINHISPYPVLTLIVDQCKPKLQAYYENIGFTFVKEIHFFSHRFNRMKYIRSSSRGQKESSKSTLPTFNEHNKKEYPPAHTAEHLLNQTMIRLFGCERSKNAHIERKKSKISYNIPIPPTSIQISEIEYRMNQLIMDNLPVTYEFLTRDNLPDGIVLDNLPTNASDILRIVRIGDYDVCACIGLHVTSTKEIGTFKITSTSYTNGLFRIVFKVESQYSCGAL